MHRFMLAWMLLALLLLGLSVSAGDGAEVRGVVSASDHEADEGYFGLGNDTMLMVKPGSSLEAWLRSHTGQKVKLTLDVDPESN